MLYIYFSLSYLSLKGVVRIIFTLRRGIGGVEVRQPWSQSWEMAQLRPELRTVQSHPMLDYSLYSPVSTHLLSAKSLCL